MSRFAPNIFLTFHQFSVSFLLIIECSKKIFHFYIKHESFVYIKQSYFVLRKISKFSILTVSNLAETEKCLDKIFEYLIVSDKLPEQ